LTKNKVERERLLKFLDCGPKHLSSAEINLIETIQKARSKGRDIEALSEILTRLQSLNRRMISLVLPNHPTIAEIPNVWRCIGWMATGEEHLTRGEGGSERPATTAITEASREIRKLLLKAIVDDILKEK